MILYGVLAFSFIEKESDLNRILNITMGHANLPAEVKELSGTNKWDVSTALVRYVEHILKLPVNTLHWNFSQTTLMDYNKINKASKKSKSEGLLDGIPLFEDDKSVLLTLNSGGLFKIFSSVEYDVNDYHKAYLLLLVATWIALGMRMFLVAKELPENFNIMYNELFLYKRLINTCTKMNINLPLSVNSSRGIGGRIHGSKLIKPIIYDFTPDLLDAFNNFVKKNPYFHIADVKGLVNGVTYYLKSIRAWE